MANDPNEIHFDCPKCQRPMSGDKALLLVLVNCPDCGESFYPTPRIQVPEPSQEASLRAQTPSSKTEHKKSRYWAEPVVLSAIGMGIFFGGKVFFGGDAFGGIGFVSLIGLSFFAYAIAKGLLCMARLKPRFLPWVILAIGLFGFYWFRSWQESHNGYVSYSQKLADFRAGAEVAVRVACTNEVTGLRQFIHMDVSTYGQSVKEWTATATVEYVNHFGGIDRTNLEFQFDELLGDLYCYKKEQPRHLPETP